MKNDIPKNYVVRIGHENNLYLEFKSQLSVFVPNLVIQNVESYLKARLYILVNTVFQNPSLIRWFKIFI